MLGELLPGVLSGRFLGVIASAEVRSAASLTALALMIEAKTKQNMSQGAHGYDEPTASSPGNGPSVVSGDLRRSVTHTPVTMVSGQLETRVGPASTPHTDYGHKRKPITSGRIGFYLETGDHGYTYPSLGPAFRDVISDVDGTFIDTFAGSAWDGS
jgi:hypothetical protein